MSIDCTSNFGTMCLEPTPSPTRTQSPTATTTATNTATSTQTPSQTASPSQTPSASNTAGTTPTQTSSNSPTASNTPSSSNTPSITASPSTSPLSPNPYIVRVTTNNVALGLYELLVWSNTGKLLSAQATAAATSLNGAASPFSMMDLCMSPYAGACPLTETTSTGEQSVSLTFQGGTLGAAPVSAVTFVNNVGAPTRITSGGGVVTLEAANGTTVGAATLNARDASTYQFAPSLAPVYPAADDAFQLSEVNRFNYVRYVRITGAATTLLTFRELIVLDATATNVALKKAVTASAQASGYTADMGNNGVVDIPVDQTTGDVSISADVNAFWEVDLGGVYDIKRVILFNRFQTVSASVGNALAGATISFMNYNRAVFVGSITLTGAGVQTYNVTLTPPTPTPSPTTSGTPTRSPTSSFGTSPTGTGTPSLTPQCPAPAATLSGVSGSVSVAKPAADYSIASFSAVCAEVPLNAMPKSVVRIDINTTERLGGTLTIDTCATAWDSVLHVGTGCGISAASYGCIVGNDDACGTTAQSSRVVITSVDRFTYFALVAPFDGNTVVPATFNVAFSYVAPTQTPSQTASPSTTATPTSTGSNTASNTASVSNTPEPTPSRTSTRTGTGTRTPTPTPSPTHSQTGTPAETATASVSATGSETASVSSSGSGSSTPSITNTGTPSPSASLTAASTVSTTVAASPSATRSRNPSQSATKTRLPTSSRTRTKTATKTRTRTATKTKTKTKTKTRTKTKTKTPSKKKLMA
jgi:hypothetical protein